MSVTKAKVSVQDGEHASVGRFDRLKRYARAIAKPEAKRNAARKGDVFGGGGGDSSDSSFHSPEDELGGKTSPHEAVHIREPASGGTLIGSQFGGGKCGGHRISQASFELLSNAFRDSLDQDSSPVWAFSGSNRHSRSSLPAQDDGSFFTEAIVLSPRFMHPRLAPKPPIKHPNPALSEDGATTVEQDEHHMPTVPSKGSGLERIGEAFLGIYDTSSRESLLSSSQHVPTNSRLIDNSSDGKEPAKVDVPELSALIVDLLYHRSKKFSKDIQPNALFMAALAATLSKLEQILRGQGVDGPSPQTLVELWYILSKVFESSKDGGSETLEVPKAIEPSKSNNESPNLDYLFSALQSKDIMGRIKNLLIAGPLLNEETLEDWDASYFDAELLAHPGAEIGVAV